MKQQAFYEAAVQVIPLLLIVLAVEFRVFRHPVFVERRLDRALGLFTILLALAGEVIALSALDGRDPTGLEHHVVWSAITTQLLMIFIWIRPRRTPIPEG